MSDFGGLPQLAQYGLDNLGGPSSVSENGGDNSPSDPPSNPTEISLRNVFGQSFGLEDARPSFPFSPIESNSDQLSNLLDFGHFLNNAPLDLGIAALRNSSKTLKCPKCNWHYKYQETLEIHMKEKHSETEIRCAYCVENRPHPKLSRGETYSCGYKPYRCELCKYSTTTKGNLSIHMQSDKHLHAVQELPNSLVNASITVPSGSSNSSQQLQIAQLEKRFVCGVCGNFTTDSLKEMLEHAERDRSRASLSDVSAVNGVFICHLCPYKTNLKANFQLHTRTDKHLQRVQMVNHVREGAGSQNANLSRLAAMKGPFQVLCRPCQEIFPSSLILREHCEAVPHKSLVRLPIFQMTCNICAFITPHKHEAINHLLCHDTSTWLEQTHWNEGSDAVVMDEEQAYACAACSFTAKEERDLEEHSKVHELGEQCPLCNERPPVLNLHLIQEHKIAEAAVERLLAVHKADILPVAGDQFAFRCPSCPLAFKNETGLQQHSLSHVFKGQHACPFCGQAGESADALIDHMNKEHPEEERKLYCELCVEQFADKTQMLAHLNSVQHLHKAKRHLEQGGIDLNNQLQSLTSPLSPIERKPFRCNLCKLSYGQGATLDIHLRSVAHQSRIAKISELIQSAEVDASKPLTEQPSGPLQKTIAEVAQAKEEEAAQQAASNPMAMFNNILNMAQLFNMKPGLLPSTSTLDDDETAPKSVATLRKMIDAIGVEEFPDSMNLLLQRLDDLSDDYVSDLVKGDCETCFQSFTSILTLKAHYEDTHEMNIPMSVLENFVTRLSKAVDEAGEESNPGSGDGSRSVSRDNSEPPEKKSRGENDVHLGDQTAQMALLNMMQGFPFLQPNPFMPMDGFFNPLLAQQMAALQAASSPAKRARTRITDDQLKVLRQYFDINNSPTEAQIKDMSVKTMLPEKVIKHWFRNTLFKERQRDKDSPYNFSVPPQMSIDLDTYEKTGEAKVVSLTPEQTNGATTPTSSTNSVEKEFKQEVKLELKEPKPPATLQALPEPPNLAALIGNLQQQNPFSFMADKEAFSSLLAGAMPGLAQVQQPTAGRRANRTRFTDYQLRTLQQFFDKQAYPKDDDLELLSKKLQLSPRVIVVWFQNARQKARKIYENQPNAENSERFVRTPGCNFQCKRCSLVFQRYYELIQHQQKKCYKDDCQAQLQDNKGVEGHLTEAEKEQLACNQETPAPESPALPDPAELLKLLGQGKSSTEALLKMCESARIPITPGNPLPTPSSSSTPSNFHKRCPFCCLLFRSRQSLLEHLPTKHNLQMQRVPVDVDLLPNADDVPSLSSTLLSGDGSAPLDLSSNGSHERNESLSVSPFLGAGSDVDDACEDIFSALAQQSMHSSQGDSRSPANNKRYRTHLTPIQVHVMKCIFTEYKTPSMAECDKLGREIGLHKRVVQVWFQNARAKERKTRMQNGQDEEVSRPLPRSCTYCSIEFSPTVSLQDHVFSPPHLTMLRSLHKGDDADVRPTDENGLRSRAPIVRDSSPKKAAAPLNPQEFPFNLLNFGIQPGTLPMLYDPTVMGTPIPLLQIPETVMQQISTDLSEGRSSTKFTQDGLTFDALVSGLAEEDAKCAAPKNSEVGWACPRCTNVFQQETLLAAHQRSICSRSEGHLTLVQTHYECLACGTHFGTQQDFKAHLSTDEHRIAKAILFPAVSSKNTSNTSPLESF